MTFKLSGSNLRSGPRKSDSDRPNHCTRCYEEKLEVIDLVRYCFKKAVDYRTFRLVDTSTKYNRTVSKYIFKMSKRMTTQKKPHTFNLFDPFSIIDFLQAFKLVCNTNGVHEGAAIRLFHLFMNKIPSAVLNARLSADSTCKKHYLSASRRKRYFTTYP